MLSNFKQKSGELNKHRFLHCMILFTVLQVDIKKKSTLIRIIPIRVDLNI